MPGQGEVRIGIIGIGFGQQVLVPAVRSDARARLVSIAASTDARARSVADRLQIPEAYGGWSALIDKSRIDAVCIAVPPSEQPDIAEAAAAAGIHIFCEKPVAINEATAERVLSAVRKAGVAHAVDFEFREIPSWQLARRLIHEGTLGDLRQVALSWRVETRSWRERRGGWKTRSEEGGGTLNQFASHSFDYLEWLFGPISRVAARMDLSDACVDVWMDLTNGISITMSIGADCFLGSGHRLEIYGDLGTMILENRTSDYAGGFTLAMGTRESGALAEIAGPEVPNGDGRIAPVGRLFSRFIDVVLDGGVAGPNLEDGVRVQHWLELARESHEMGAWRS